MITHMSRIFITGDMHGNLSRFHTRNFPEGERLAKDDYVIVCGDFGLIWEVNASNHAEKVMIEWLNGRPWTTLFADGNHENFDRLLRLPQIEKFGSQVGMVSDSIFHLRRGETYRIGGYVFLIIGGACSIDKKSRKKGVSWWHQEIPGMDEMGNALRNLAKNQFSVDFIITHTAPITAINRLLYNPHGHNIYYYDARIRHDITTSYLEHLLPKVKFGKWFFGHFHDDYCFEIAGGRKFHALHNSITEITDVFL